MTCVQPHAGFLRKFPLFSRRGSVQIPSGNAKNRVYPARGSAQIHPGVAYKSTWGSVQMALGFNTSVGFCTNISGVPHKEKRGSIQITVGFNTSVLL